MWDMVNVTLLLIGKIEELGQVNNLLLCSFGVFGASLHALQVAVAGGMIVIMLALAINHNG